KNWFNETKARRAFLWLDFCYSGGIHTEQAARSAESVSGHICRALTAEGHGKVIVAACAAWQESWERDGHGLLNPALVQGLRGEARSQYGVVTACSLFDYVCNAVSGDQTPTMSGKMEGRLVLMHSASGATDSESGYRPTDRRREEGDSARQGRLLETLGVHAGRNCLE